MEHASHSKSIPIHFFVCFISFIPLLLYIFIRLYIHTYDSLSQSYYNPSVVRYSRQKKRYFHSLYFILFFFHSFLYIREYETLRVVVVKWALRDSSTHYDIAPFVQHHIQQRRDWLSNVCKNHAWLYGLLLVCNRLLYTSFI